MSEERDNMQSNENAAPSGKDMEVGSVDDVASEIAELKDRLLRALAEQQNISRRAQREIREATQFGASNLGFDLLSTADNLRRAIESAPQDNASDEHFEKLLAGIVATERALLESLEKHNIRRIGALGEPFDPNVHEAVYEVTGSDCPPGTVVQVLQPGYLHHERLLRPAMVAVAKDANKHAADQGNVNREKSPGDGKKA